jgi:Na+/phosphate symporter
MIVITLDVFLLIIGLFMYVLSTDGKIQEIGRIIFFCALFAMLFGADKILQVLSTR